MFLISDIAHIVVGDEMVLVVVGDEIVLVIDGDKIVLVIVRDEIIHVVVPCNCTGASSVPAFNLSSIGA